MSVAQCQDSMTYREFREWQAYSRIVPIGPERDGWLAGTIAAFIANAAPSKSRKVWQPDDCVPWLKDRRRQSPAEMYERMRLIANRMNKQLGATRIPSWNEVTNGTDEHHADESNQHWRQSERNGRHG